MSIGSEDSGIIFGGFATPVLPVSGYIQFALAMERERVKAQVLLPWQTLQSVILRQIVAAPPARQTSIADFAPGRLELRVDDEWLGRYLDFSQIYFGKQTATVLETLGNFAVFIHEIANMKKTGRFHLVFQGLRDGIPEFGLSLEMPRNEAEAIILKQRRSLREARDTQILTAAATIYSVAHDGTMPTTVNELSEYLAHEPDGYLGRYTIVTSPAQVVPAQPVPVTPVPVTPVPAQPVPVTPVRAINGDYVSGKQCSSIPLVPPPPSDEDFRSDAYEILTNQHVIHLLSPPFTVNDEQYRLRPMQDVNVEALKSNRFRFAAYYDEQRARLLIATDPAALDVFMQSSNTAQERQYDVALSKLTLSADPRWLVHQARNYPIDWVRASVDEWELNELDRYTRIDILLRPDPTRNAFFATIDARND